MSEAVIDQKWFWWNPCTIDDCITLNSNGKPSQKQMRRSTEFHDAMRSGRLVFVQKYGTGFPYIHGEISIYEFKPVVAEADPNLT